LIRGKRGSEGSRVFSGEDLASSIETKRRNSGTARRTAGFAVWKEDELGRRNNEEPA
jgi:hypothetical protein